MNECFFSSNTVSLDLFLSQVSLPFGAINNKVRHRRPPTCRLNAVFRDNEEKNSFIKILHTLMRLPCTMNGTKY